MPTPPLDDRALETLLRGARSPQSGFDWLVPFVEELGEASSEPAPVVRPALATLLANGFSPVAGEAPAMADAARPPAALPTLKKRVPVGGFAAGLATKFAGLGLAAKAGLGLSLVAASTTAAGAVGVLPDAAQHAVATVVGAATPFTFPDAASDKAGFGSSVSADATGTSDGTPGVDGKAVADAAKTKHDAVTPTTGGPGTNNGVGVGANTGATGLERANETPAAGHVPTSLPTPGGGTPGSQATKGLETANTTPAAGKVPTSVPAVTPGSNGTNTASSTPAGGRTPTSIGRP